MNRNSVFLEVKGEQFEVRNMVDYGNSDDNPDSIESCCCLCLEGIELQNMLVEHLRSAHPNLTIDYLHNSFQGLQCCNCNEGAQLQINFINHILSHISAVKAEIADEEVAAEENFQFGESFEADEMCESPEPKKREKTKPSYHKQYNRKDRSPETQRLQLEFTRDAATKQFHCNFCRNGYKHKQTVERHLSKEHDPRKKVKEETSKVENFTLVPQTKTFYCNLCDIGYKHKQTVERHLAKEHNIVVPKNRLSSSAYLSSDKEQDEVDARRRRKKAKNLVCDLCGQHFLFRESLRKHLLRHKDPNPKDPKTPKEKIVCDQCTKLVDRNLMKRHFQVHHSDYRPFRCEEPGCKTSFFDVNKFKDHKNIHLNIKPYVCEFCQEAFHYASNWRQHKLRHTHPDRFKCDICSHCFVSTKSLRMHLRLHAEIDPDAPKPYACDQEGCEKTFRYLDRLKLHVFNVHRSEPENKCELCPFVTHRKKYLKRHMLKVHNVQIGNPRNRVFPISYPDM